MTFDEAAEMTRRIKGYVIGMEIKGRKIDSLFIGPTKWRYMNEYLNRQVQEGVEAAVCAFADRSFSVYGVSIEESPDAAPRYSMTILDDFEKIMSN